MRGISGIVSGGIIEDLQSALEELQAISDDLAQTPGALRRQDSHDEAAE